MKAIIQLGYAVFGTGATESEAIADAKQWVDEPEGLEEALIALSQAVDGDLVLVECTETLHEMVQEHGGDVLFGIFDGVAHVIVD